MRDRNIIRMFHRIYEIGLCVIFLIFLSISLSFCFDFHLFSEWQSYCSAFLWKWNKFSLFYRFFSSIWEKTILANLFSHRNTLFCRENRVKRGEFYLTLYPSFHIMSAYFASTVSSRRCSLTSFPCFGHLGYHCIRGGFGCYVSVILGLSQNPENPETLDSCFRRNDGYQILSLCK